MRQCSDSAEPAVVSVSGEGSVDSVAETQGQSHARREMVMAWQGSSPATNPLAAAMLRLAVVSRLRASADVLRAHLRDPGPRGRRLRPRPWGEFDAIQGASSVGG
jgi:hypothetical protein